jgi:putative transposase
VLHGVPMGMLTLVEPPSEKPAAVSAIQDLHSGRVVGFPFDARMKAPLASAALCSAIIQREPIVTVVHGD